MTKYVYTKYFDGSNVHMTHSPNKPKQKHFGQDEIMLMVCVVCVSHFTLANIFSRSRSLSLSLHTITVT